MGAVNPLYSFSSEGVGSFLKALTLRGSGAAEINVGVKSLGSSVVKMFIADKV